MLVDTRFTHYIGYLLLLDYFYKEYITYIHSPKCSFIYYIVLVYSLYYNYLGRSPFVSPV
uniref:Uncharacterized protein n=1 Tax=Myoviridae sp. ctsK93 TaxID=2825190 RepID=A0A8S5PJA0_9CAUD|nr:MAG TPA: hypothetical protein [Myoviridae sp. ctsK93]